MASDTLVDVSDLRFSFGSHKVLGGLSLKVPRGKVTAILGPSGCGKSTLLQLIGGQIAPEGGTVSIDGKIVSELDNDALYAMAYKASLSSSLTILPSIETVPPSGAIWPPINCSKVLLPHPLGPSMAVTLPRGTLSESPPSTLWLPKEKRKSDTSTSVSEAIVTNASRLNVGCNFTLNPSYRWVPTVG